MPTRKAKQGYREDLPGMFFRSSWEANYARYLDFLVSKGAIYKWEFEPDTFWFENIKRGVRSYLPDFKIWRTKTSKPYYVEVKGHMDRKSKTKLKRFLKYYPDEKIELVDGDFYERLKCQYAAMIPNWEH